MRTLLKILGTLALLLFPVDIAWGQASFEELRATLLKSSPELRAAQERIRQAEARLAEAGLRPNPSFDYERSTDLVFGHEGEGSDSLTFTLPVELAGKRHKRVSVAEAEVEVAKAEMRDLERQLTGKLRVSYTQAIAASLRRQVTEKLVVENEGLQRVMDVRLKSGDASKLESTLLLAETRRLRLQAMRTSGEERTRRINLQSLAGLEAAARLDLAAEPEFVKTNTPEIQATLEEAFRMRSDLEAARLREESAERSVLVHQASQIPDVNAFLGYNRDRNVLEGLLPGGSLFVDRGNELVFGISLDLPVFSHHRARVAEAISARHQARADREALERQVRLEISSAAQRASAAQDALNLATTELVSGQQESVRILQLSYELGNAGLADLLTQRRLLVETELTLVDLREELWLALADLETAVGR